MKFGPDGNLYVGYVSTNPLEGGVKRYNGTTGAYLDDFVGSGSGGGFTCVQDLVFGPDGNLYVTHYWPSEAIVRYNGTTGAFMSVFVSSYGLPVSLAFGPDDNLWVALYHGSRIKRYNITTGADLGTIVLPWPAGIAFGPDGNLYATERYVNMGGKVERYNGTTGALMGGFATPLGGVQTELGLQWFPLAIWSPPQPVRRSYPPPTARAGTTAT